MGRLDFASGRRLYLDTAPIIYAIEEHDVYWLHLQPIWTAFTAGEVQIVTSEITLLETLVRPLRDRDSKLADTYNELLTGSEVFLIPISTDILRAAAELRAKHNLKTPDAIHAATAITSGCQYLIANDNGFRRITTIDVIILDDLI
ncbi:MAG: PIN domain-containing protein [Pyrinomonadaceae bacterium]